MIDFAKVVSVSSRAPITTIRSPGCASSTILAPQSSRAPEASGGASGTVTLRMANWALGLLVLGLGSGLFVLLMSSLIMWQTQDIIRGGETNYIMATVTLYVAIFNLFTSLLHLLGFMNGQE